MRVLYFHQHFTIPSIGGGTRSYEFAKRLIERGHSVSIVCGEVVQLNLPPTSTKGISRGEVDGIDVIQISLPYSNRDGISKRTWTFLKFSYLGIKIALKEKYDILFATSTPLTAGIPGIVMKWFRKKKFIFEVRDLWPELPKALGLKNPLLIWGMSLLEWLSYRSANACIGLAPGICKGIAKRSSKNKRIEFIPNGCDLDLFKRGHRSELSLEGICPKDTVAVFTGAHGISNGLNSVLDAAAELKKMNRNDIVLVFIGEGKLKPALMQRAKEHDLQNCRFYPLVSKRELNQIVSNADIGMMILANIPAFYYSTSPNKFFDYISSGLPVLNNYPGWLADMIKEKQIGIAVPPDDAVAFAKGLIHLADRSDLRELYGKNARDLAEKSFARQELADKFVDFLEEVHSLSPN
jgi:glycosyltransferase involved in cell wall biosynthesis